MEKARLGFTTDLNIFLSLGDAYEIILKSAKDKKIIYNVIYGGLLFKLLYKDGLFLSKLW